MNHTAAPLFTFGSGQDAWGSYSYAATGQTAPTATATDDGNGIQISGGFVAPVTSSTNYEGVGLYYNSASCLDATAYTGVQFDFSGTLGGCAIQLGASFSGDASPARQPRARHLRGDQLHLLRLLLRRDDRGARRNAVVAHHQGAVQRRSPAGCRSRRSIRARILTVQWQLTSRAGATDGGACSANFTVENVKFF